MAWVLQNDNVASAIIGASRPEQVQDNAAAAGVKLEEALLSKIDEVLIRFSATAKHGELTQDPISPRPLIPESSAFAVSIEQRGLTPPLIDSCAETADRNPKQRGRRNHESHAECVGVSQPAMTRPPTVAMLIAQPRRPAGHTAARTPRRQRSRPGSSARSRSRADTMPAHR